MGLIDSLVNFIYDARIRNYEVWPVIDKQLFGDQLSVSTSYENDTSKMKNWLRARLKWMDANVNALSVVPSSVNPLSAGNINSFETYPNPFTTQLTIDMNIVNESNFEVNITDMTGRTESLTRNLKLHNGFYRLKLNSKDISGLHSGVYILTINENGTKVYQEKVFKN
jgi:hypothetical protein